VSESRPERTVERQRRWINRKRRIAYRLRARAWKERSGPMFAARNIHYDLAEKDRGLGEGGIGAMHLLARRVGLIERIDKELRVLKRHLPYHESDHVLNLAYNILCGGTWAEDIELRRNDEGYLDALGAERIPDPTTEGDFCRRFEAADVETLMDAIHETRIGVRVVGWFFVCCRGIPGRRCSFVGWTSCGADPVCAARCAVDAG